MRLVDRLGEETEAFHDSTDEEVLRLLVTTTTAEDYRRYLVQMYGFLCPLERSIAQTPGIDRHIDVQRFRKHGLLRRDLSALHMSSDEIACLPRCEIPWFLTPEEALGWAYPIERSALRHGELCRHLASILPGEVAFASSYVGCHAGATGEAWGAFGEALDRLDRFEHGPHGSELVIEAARAAFRGYRAWRSLCCPPRPRRRSVWPGPPLR